LTLTLAQLQRGQRAKILDFNVDEIPLKLLEMGCLPGNEVALLQVAPFGDPLYITVNDSHVAIRLETAKEIHIEIVKEP
jgi:ferrous iron transport protein A